MRALTLLYHDVIPDGDFAASGFGGAGADVYKMTRERFERHLSEIAAVRPGAPSAPGAIWDLVEADDGRITTRRDVSPGVEMPLLLTFDDGGATAHPVTTDLLDERGWTGHFFVTTGRIGTPGFVDEDAIRAMRRAGHVVGSHSRSHPPRMSRLTRTALVDEWKRSAGHLSDILGEPVRVASVPGGYYSRRVAEAASEAGIRVLFTSEPVTRALRVEDTVVLGRYTLQRDAPAGLAAAMAAGRRVPRLRQWSAWNAKKAAKRLGGRHYITWKDAILRSRTRGADG